MKYIVKTKSGVYEVKTRNAIKTGVFFECVDDLYFIQKSMLPFHKKEELEPFEEEIILDYVNAYESGIMSHKAVLLLILEKDRKL